MMKGEKGLEFIGNVKKAGLGGIIYQKTVQAMYFLVKYQASF